MTKVTLDEGAIARIKALAVPMEQKITEEIALEMSNLCPVDTGFLRNSIVVGEKEITVNADYWKYVEYGTRKTPAQPFIRPAIAIVTSRRT